MSTASRMLSHALIPLLAILLAVAPATAATPENLTERCIARIMYKTDKATQVLDQSGVNGAEKIDTLDTNDRPVRLLRRSAIKSNVKIEKRETKSDRAVNKTADKCLRILARHDADPALAQQINDARALAINTIHAASAEAHTAVNDALEAALEDEEVEEESVE